MRWTNGVGQYDSAKSLSACDNDSKQTNNCSTATMRWLMVVTNDESAALALIIIFFVMVHFAPRHRVVWSVADDGVAFLGKGDRKTVTWRLMSQISRVAATW
jgi:hypothetical protein